MLYSRKLSSGCIISVIVVEILQNLYKIRNNERKNKRLRLEA